MLYRHQVVLRHGSGLPRDNITNTWWVENANPAVSAADAELQAERIRDFYVSDAGASQSIPIMNFLNNSMTGTGHQIKSTPIAPDSGLDARGLGMPPLWTEVFDFVSWAPQSVGLPNEVACCLSFKNMTSGSVPPARRRGRVYIGPLTTYGSALQDGAWRPGIGLRDDLLAAANKLHDDLLAAGSTWVVYSRPYEGRDEVPRPGNPRGPLPALPARDGETYPVTDLWVDNAFDTQRKRGERATLRVTQVA